MLSRTIGHLQIYTRSRNSSHARIISRNKNNTLSFLSHSHTRTPFFLNVACMRRSAIEDILGKNEVASVFFFLKSINNVRRSSLACTRNLQQLVAFALIRLLHFPSFLFLSLSCFPFPALPYSNVMRPFSAIIVLYLAALLACPSSLAATVKREDDEEKKMTCRNTHTVFSENTDGWKAYGSPKGTFELTSDGLEMRLLKPEKPVERLIDKETGMNTLLFLGGLFK